MSEELPNYFEDFKPNRTKLGEALGKREVMRRLAHYLQVPQHFGERILLAYDSVLKDALEHGEGFRIAGVGTLTIHKHKEPDVLLLGEWKKRTKRYYYKWRVARTSREHLEYLTKLDEQGVIDDYFQDAEDTEFQVD